MKRKTLFTTLFFISIYCTSFAQFNDEPNQYWYDSKFTKHIGDSNIDEVGIYTVQDSNKDIYYVGFTNTSASDETKQVLVRKMDVDGEFIWEQKYKATFQGDDVSIFPESVILLQEENLIVGTDRNICKIDGATGDLLWAKKLSGENNSSSSKDYSKIIPTPSGGFLMVRSFKTFDGPTEILGFLLIEFDSDGDVLWSRANGHDSEGTFELDIRPKDLKKNNDGSIAILYERFMQGGSGTGGHQMAISQTDNAGNMTSYSYMYNRPGINEFRPVTLTAYSPNNISILGNYNDNEDLVDAELYYLYIRANGDIHTQRIYECLDADVALYGRINQGGGCRAAGVLDNAGFSVDVGLAGNLSAGFYEEPGSEVEFYSVTRAADSRLLLSGKRDQDGILLKTGTGFGSECDIDATACFSVCATSGIVKSDYPNNWTESQEISTISSNFVVSQINSEKLCDKPCFEEGEWKTIIIGPGKGDEKVGGGNIKSDDTNSDRLVIFPNPTTGIINMNFDLNSTDSRTILLQDLVGNEYLTKTLSKDQKKIQLDVSSLRNGVYFLRVYDNEGLRHLKRITIHR